MLQGKAHNVRVIAAGQTAVAANHYHQDTLGLLATLEQGMQIFAARLASNMRQNLPGFGGIGARIHHRLHGLAHLAGANRLQGASNLGDILDTPDTEPYFTSICHKISSTRPGFEADW